MLRVGKCKLQALAAAATLAAPAISLAQITATWIAPGNGDWNVVDNWGGTSFPSGGGAAILAAPLAPIQVNVPVGFGTTLSNINFLGTSPTNNFTLSGSGSIMIGTTAGSSGTIDVATGGTGTISNQLATQANGNLFKTGAGSLILSGTNAFGTASGLQINAGIVQVNSSTSLTGLGAITTGTTGQFVLNNASVTGAAIGGLGSNPTGGTVRSLAGNNTWNGSWFVVAPASVGVDAGSLTLTGVVFDQTATTGFTKLGAGTFAAGQLSLNGTLTISAGTIRLTDNGAPSVTSRAGTLSIAGGAVPTAKLDLRNNDFILNYTGASPLSTVRSQITAAYAGGAWSGNGITTTLGGTIVGGPFAGKKAALGYAEATALGSPASFNGYAIDGTTLLVKYTLAGDANLDGDADTADVLIWSSNYTGAVAGSKLWSEGDWDYDGDVDVADVLSWSSNYTGELGGAGLGPIMLSASVNPDAASILGSLGFDVTVVPEPGSFGIVAAGFGGLAGMRRRRSKNR